VVVAAAVVVAVLAVTVTVEGMRRTCALPVAYIRCYLAQRKLSMTCLAK
jgi:hypothetical protein